MRKAPSNKRGLLQLFRSIKFKVKRLSEEYPLTVMVAAFSVILLASIAILLIGDQNITNFGLALWWAIVTFTTVGYGDFVPSGPEGRFVALGIMVMGFIFTSVVSGFVASIFVERRLREGKGLKEIKMRDHIALCGWNETAESILEALPDASGKNELDIVLVNELDEQKINEIKYKFSNMNIKFVRGSFIDETILKFANIQEADSALILSDEINNKTLDTADERTILAAFTIKSLNPNIKICAELNKRSNIPHLRRASVEEVIVRGEFLGFLLSNAVASSGLVETVREMLTFKTGSTLFEWDIPSHLVGKRFSEASNYFCANKNSILIGILSDVRDISLQDILDDDSDALDRFIQRKFLEADQEYFYKDRLKHRIKLNPGGDYVIREVDKAVLISPES